MQVRVLGAHNLQTRDTLHTCFLIDGVLALDVGSLVSALTPAEQGRIQALLLTHQHFDHTRDIPTLGLTTLDDPRPIDVYSQSETLKSVHAHLIDGDVYPDFTQKLNDAPPKYRFHPIEPGVPFKVLEYEINAVPMLHPVPTVGYIVKSNDGGSIGYTGDTGGNLLPFFQDGLSPKVLFVDVTFPNRLKWRAKLTGHMTPGFLRDQLVQALTTNTVTLPRIVAVHRDVASENEVIEELSAVTAELGVDLIPGYEEMVVA